MSFCSSLAFLLIDSNVSSPTIFLNALRVTLLTVSNTYVGETLRVRALFSSIGTATSFEALSNDYDLSMALRALLRWSSASDPCSTIERAYETRVAASLF